MSNALGLLDIKHGHGHAGVGARIAGADAQSVVDPLQAQAEPLADRLQGPLNIQIVTDEQVIALDAGNMDPGNMKGPNVNSPNPDGSPPGGLAAGPGGLSMALRLVVFRTAEEALNNVLKHARASNVTLWLTLSGGRLALDVTDDGQGFGVERTPPGLGLLCLGARIGATSRHWQLSSRSGGPSCTPTGALRQSDLPSPTISAPLQSHVGIKIGVFTVRINLYKTWNSSGG